MYHRLATVDLLVSLELSVRKRTHLAIITTLLEYRRVKRGNQIVHETMDYVDSQESSENKIIPDAASNCKFDLQWVDGCHMTLTRLR